jgi:hypothetical protein
MMLACSENNDPDGGKTDDPDESKLSPCEAAAPLWNEIWKASLDVSGLEGTTPEINIMDVWGESADNIFAVGFNGSILHYDGTAWSSMESGTKANLEGVWGYIRRNSEGGITRTDIFAVGGQGSVLRYDGTSWNLQLSVNDPDPAHPNPAPIHGSFHDVWGIPAAGDDAATHHPYVVAVGGDGLIARYDSENNRFVEMRRRETFVDSQGRPRYSYLRWSHDRLGGVFGTGSLADPLFVAVGNNGTIVELSGNTWTKSTSFNPPGAFASHLFGIWGRGRSSMYIAGIDGMILRRENSGQYNILHKQNPDWLLDPVNLRAYWQFSQDHCGERPKQEEDQKEQQPKGYTAWRIFVGWDGAVIMEHTDNEHKSLVCRFQVPTTNRLQNVWGTTPRSASKRAIEEAGDDVVDKHKCDPVEVIITGVNGTILRLSNPAGR